MNLETAIKQKVRNNKYPTLTRIKVGKALSVIAALPLFTSWMFIFSVPMMMPMSPTLYTKDKIRYFNEWRSLR